MKVCLLTTRHALDDDLIYFRHARSLAKRYAPVWLVGPGKERSCDDTQDGASVCRRAISDAAGSLGRVRRMVAALRTVKQLRPDVCHFYDPELLLVVPLLRRICSKGVIYDALEAYPEAVLARDGIPSSLRRTVARGVDWLEKRLARGCVRIFTADEATARDFANRGLEAVCLFNYPPKALFAVPAVPAADEGAAVAGPPTGIYVGSMSPERGLFKMIEATALVRRQEARFRLLLIGLRDGPLRRAAEDLVRRYRVGEGVEMLPWIPHEQVRAYVAGAKVGLAPLQPIAKYHKNIPQKIFEYMACGIPIVGSNLPTIAPFIEAGRCGVVTDCTRADLLAQAILRVLGDDKSWREMSRNGRLAFESKYNWENMEPRLWAAYQDL